MTTPPIKTDNEKEKEAISIEWTKKAKIGARLTLKDGKAKIDGRNYWYDYRRIREVE